VIHVKGSSTEIRNEINIFNLSERIQNNGLNCIHIVEGVEPEHIPNSEWNVHLEERDTLKTRSYAGSMLMMMAIVFYKAFKL
jgi:hypothetical protein